MKMFLIVETALGRRSKRKAWPFGVVHNSCECRYRLAGYLCAKVFICLGSPYARESPL